MLQKTARKGKNTIFPKPPVADNSVPSAAWSLKYLYDFLFQLRQGKGITIMDQDWDTLILLDACRYDDFKKINHLPGSLNSKISKGVDSREFIQNNFVGNEFPDTVYVTANPHVKMLDSDSFHDILTDPIESWDEELQCVKPQDVTAAAMTAHKKYPHKRIIVHYMQPHDPPLGPTADTLRERFNISGTTLNNTSEGQRIMELAADGQVTLDVARQAYQETLGIVLTEVEGLLQEIDGKIVISSDHGEMFGESPYPFLGKLYEHYQNPKTTQLCKVPWFVVDTENDRRKISISSNNSTVNEVDDAAIQTQLKALGYKQ